MSYFFSAALSKSKLHWSLDPTGGFFMLNLRLYHIVIISLVISISYHAHRQLQAFNLFNAQVRHFSNFLGGIASGLHLSGNANSTFV